MRYVVIVLYAVGAVHVGGGYNREAQTKCVDLVFERSIVMMLGWPVFGFYLWGGGVKDRCEAKK